MLSCNVMAEADLGVRDAKGEWQPANLPQPSPMWDRPVRTKVILKAIFGHDGILWPKNLVYMAIAVVAWLFLTPSLERTATFQVGWIAEIYLRNVALLVLIAGGLHLRLYIKRAQGKKFKYNGRWLAKKNRAFLFGNQTWDNMFWSLVSGAGIWTAYEAVTLWMYGNGWLPRVEWRTPAGIAYCSLMMLAVLFIRQMHFYWTHRWTHWKPLYKIAHYLHHRNVNIGPWSGLSMHPIEHLIYFSGVLVHWGDPVAPHPRGVPPHAHRAEPGGRPLRLLGVRAQGRQDLQQRRLFPLPAPPLLRVQLRQRGRAAGQVVRQLPRRVARGARGHARPPQAAGVPGRTGAGKERGPGEDHRGGGLETVAPGDGA